MSLRDDIMRTGKEAGLDRVGVTHAGPFPDVRSTLLDRKRSGMSAQLTFTYNRPERSTDIRESIPWAESLVVGARSYLPQAGSPPHEPGTGRIARFMVGSGYDDLRQSLASVRRHLEDAGHRATVVADDNRLVDRAAAVRAGVGWWGKNTMVLVPGVGPWALLGSVVTDAVLDPTPPDARSCGSCAACLPACPTGALVAPGVLDARRCLAAVLQAPGPIPAWMRPLVGDRVYGCDDCIEACPPGSRLLDAAGAPRGTVDLEWLLAASDEEILADLDRLYLPRRRPGTLRRNALVAVGNAGLPEGVRLARPYLDDPDPVLASHARWAVETIREAQEDASGK